MKILQLGQKNGLITAWSVVQRMSHRTNRSANTLYKQNKIKRNIYLILLGMALLANF